MPHTDNPPLQVITLSGGVCNANTGDIDMPERVLEEADRALYRAKANGPNRVEIAGDGELASAS